jgi:hypothetical protein
MASLRVLGNINGLTNQLIQGNLSRGKSMVMESGDDVRKITRDAISMKVNIN